jgi:anthranilate synthase
MSTTEYETDGGIRVRRSVEDVPVATAIEPVVAALDARRGVLLASNYEYPGRYTRWDMGFVDPAVALVARGRAFRFDALNARGRVLLPAIAGVLAGLGAVEHHAGTDEALEGVVRTPSGPFVEEDRSRQPSIFSVLRAVIALFHHRDEPHLGLYGAFGYDLAFQFEPIRLRLPRPDAQRDLVLYLPDELIVVDHRRQLAMRRRYDFEVGGRSTRGEPRTGAEVSYGGASAVSPPVDHAPGE